VEGAGPGEALTYVFERAPDTIAWMGLDLALALVPLVLAVLLFRPSRRTSALWWIGFATFVAFLPNAAYVWAGYLWFFGQVRSAWVLDQWRIPPLLAPYLAYFGLGSLAFVECVHRARAFFAARWSPARTGALVVALCACTAFGLYLGRADFNSWSLVTDLPGVLRALGQLPEQGDALARTALAFMGVLALFAVSERVRARLVAPTPAATPTGVSPPARDEERRRARRAAPRHRT
jgi:uncharacterized membrane protein